MAKKVVATLKGTRGDVKYAKLVRAVKLPSGAYTFKHEIMPEEEAKKVLIK